MFARIFRVHLKPLQGDAYTRAVEQKVAPVLQRSRGFRDEITMISGDGTEAVGITFWDRKEDIEAYERTSYVETRRALEPFMVSAPMIEEPYQVTTSTLAQVPA